MYWRSSAGGNALTFVLTRSLLATPGFLKPRERWACWRHHRKVSPDSGRSRLSLAGPASFSQVNAAAKVALRPHLRRFHGPDHEHGNNLGWPLSPARGLDGRQGLVTVVRLRLCQLFRAVGLAVEQIAQLFNRSYGMSAGGSSTVDETPEKMRPFALPRGRKACNSRWGVRNRQEVSVLKDVSLHAEPGQMIAWLGRPAPGKNHRRRSPVFTMWMAAIRIDGSDSAVDDRTQLGLVLQDNFRSR
jgi:hypothetical protein